MLAATRWPSATAETTSGPRTMSPAAHSQGSLVRPVASTCKPAAGPGELLGEGLPQQAGVAHLAYGLDDHVRGVELLVGRVEARGEAPVGVEDGLDVPGLEAGDPIPFDHDLLGPAGVEDARCPPPPPP